MSESFNRKPKACAETYRNVPIARAFGLRLNDNMVIIRRAAPLGIRYLLAVVCLASLFAQRGQAGSGAVVTLPSPGVKNKSGLRLDIDARWVSGSGYRPVRVRVSPQPFGPATADRTIEVRLRPRGFNYGSKGGAVTATVELKQGATFGEAIISAPQTNIWNAIGVETREDGWRHRDLCADQLGMTNRYYANSPDNSPAVLVVHWAADDRTRVLPGGSTSFFSVPNGKLSTLFVEPSLVLGAGGMGLVPVWSPRNSPTILYRPIPMGMASMGMAGMGMAGMGWDGGSGVAVDVSSLPDIRPLAGRFPEGYGNMYGVNNLDVFSTQTPATDAALERLIADLPNLDLLPPNLLPDRWLDYTNIDVLILSRSDLRALKEQFPEKWGALRTWLSSGPMLCVYDAGTDFERLADIEELLLAEPLVTGDGANEPLRGWEEPNVKHFTESVNATQGSVGNTMWQQQVLAQRAANPAAPMTPPPPTPQKPLFVSRPVGQGRLVAIAAENPFPGNEHEWNWLFNSIPSRNWLTYQRNGLSHYQENMQFWAFLVEGIGKAPVKTFLALITLFAIVIGPVNYFALQRRGKLYLLLVTVPVGAGLISGGLFLFAMIGDGFGTRVRLRSYTELDPRRGKAITWSRQTYYAGFAPSRGLSYPAEAAVYPVEHRPVSGSGMEDTRRDLVWTDEQNLVAGYFTSRTMAQFVVVEPQSTTAAIRVVESPNGSPPEVVNELGMDIERLALCDSRGNLFEIVNLAVGQKATATEMDKGQVGAEWRTRYRAARPAFPEGFNPNSLDDVSEFFSSGMWRPATSGPAPTFETSVLETGIRASLDQDFESLTPGSFVAILPRSPFVSLGVDVVGTESGFHVVAGRW